MIGVAVRKVHLVRAAAVAVSVAFLVALGVLALVGHAQPITTP